jgi:hypothetical protein
MFAAQAGLLGLLRVTGQAGVLATFITANGSTATSWSVAGPTGGTLNGSTNTLTLAANNTLAGAVGTGAINLGSMTSNTTLPTGNITYTGTASKAFSFTANGGVDNIVDTGAGGFLSIDASEIDIGDTYLTALQIGASNPTINIGSLSGSTNPISIGSTTSAALLTIQGNTNSGGSTPFLTIGPNFQPVNEGTLSCSTGGTQTILPDSFGLAVTTGTLGTNTLAVNY